MIWLIISLLQIKRISCKRSDYASNPSDLEAIESTDNRVQPNPNLLQLNSQTNMIPSTDSTPVHGGFPINPQGQPMVTNRFGFPSHGPTIMSHGHFHPVGHLPSAGYCQLNITNMYIFIVFKRKKNL